MALKLAVLPTDPRGRKSGSLLFRKSADTWGQLKWTLDVVSVAGWQGKKRLKGGETWSPNPVLLPETGALVKVTRFETLLL